MEIKFRAWDEWLGRMVYWDEFQERYNMYVFDNAIKRIHPMQFTGLKDRNGVEIYEGDIIKYHYFYFSNGSEIENECVCSVKWDDTFANFDAMDKNGFAHFLGQASDDGIEVIGNIYEHPDLLK